MATASHAGLPAFLSSDADFRTWGAGVKALLAALGTLTQTADTGQIDWATVVKPVAINTVGGYEVYRFNDSLQATRPVFIKVEYGTGGAVDRPSIWVTVGSASNGAGTLTGQLSTRHQNHPAASKTAGAVLPARASGDASGFWLGVNLDAASTNFGLLIAVERPRKFDGTVSDKGAYYVGVNANSSQSHVVPYTGTVPAALVGMMFPPWRQSGGGPSSFGGDISLSPLFVVIGELLGSRLLIASTADIATMTTFAMAYLGATRTMLAFGATLLVRTATGSTDSSYAVVGIYE